MMRPILFLMLAAGILSAQDDPTIRLDVQQVLVPVVVADKKGHHVSGLRATDFRILEDGVEQRIAAFSSDTAASVDDLGALAKSSPNAPAGTKAAGPRRTFVICVDTLHTSPVNAARMRAALESLFEKEKPSDAQYVLIGIGRQLQVLQPATANPLEILLKIRSTAFQSMMGSLDASALAIELGNLRTRMEDFCRRCSCAAPSSRQSCDGEIDTLKQSVDAAAARWVDPTNAFLAQFANVVGELAKLPTGRTLILVSDGFTANPVREFYRTVSAYLPNRPQFQLQEPNGAEPGLREALKVAAERNVAIYAVDSRGGSTPTLARTGAMDAAAGAAGNGNQTMLGTNRGNAGGSARAAAMQADAASQPNPFASESNGDMEQLAGATGGVYFHGGSDLLKEFRSALADGREYYTLAYVPKNIAPDGKFRRITVETTDRKLTIRAKAGYWAAGPDQ